jgi:hypothetical protein
VVTAKSGSSSFIVVMAAIAMRNCDCPEHRVSIINFSTVKQSNEKEKKLF